MSDYYTLGPTGSELDLSDTSKHYVRRDGYRVIRDNTTGKATAIELDVWFAGTSTEDTGTNIASVQAKLTDAELAFGAASAGAPVRLGRRLGTSTERRYWVIKKGVLQEQEQIDPDSQARPYLLTLTLGDSGQYGEPVALTVTGTLTNGAAVVVLDGIETEDPAPIALTLTAVAGTPQGYRVGLMNVPAGTVASDFDHVVDLSQASGASSTTTSAVDVGSNYRNRAITTGTSWDDIGTATQPAGSQNQGKRHVYVRGYDTPGTPSLSAPSGLTADDVGPTLSGGTTQDATTYDTPTQSGSTVTNTASGASALTSLNLALNPGATAAGALLIAALTWQVDTDVPAPGNATITLPSGWQLYYQRNEAPPGASSGLWAVAYRQNATASPGSQTFTFTTANAGPNREAWGAIMAFTNVTSDFPFSAMATGLLTVVDASSGQAQTPATAVSQLQPNERALAFLRDVGGDDGGVTAWSQGWTSFYSGGVDIGTMVRAQASTVQATVFGNGDGSDSSAVISIIGTKSTATSTLDQDRVDAGNFRAGTYNLRAQWVDASGNVSTPTSSVPVVVASDGSRIDGSLTPQAGAGHYLLSWSRPQGGFRQVAITDTTFSLTDDNAGRTLTALPTAATVTSVPSNNRLMVGTAAEQGAAGRRFALPTTSMHTVRAGTYDLPPVAATSDGTRPSWGIHTEAQSGSAGVSATVRHDALFLFPTDAFVTMHAKGTARATFIYELRPDGVIAARTEGSGNVGQVVAPSELHVWKGSNVLVIEALGTKNATIEDCFASNLALTFTAQVTYTPRYRG